MIVDNISDSFSEIGTVVFYKHHKFFPDSFEIITEDGDTIETFKSDLVKYHGSDRNFPGLNFAEYDFSYFPDKYRFGDKLLLTELDNVSAEIVGNKIEDTSNIEKVLFPTLVDEETTNPYNYFGSLNVSGKTLYFFECPEEYATIEIYEGVIDSNCPNGFIEYRYLQLSGETNILHHPAAIISLGPEKDLFNNPTEFYYNQDPLKPRSKRTKEETLLKYSRLCDEITGKKIVCFLLSTSNNVIEFNLAFSAWNHSSNPLRNKWKYDLRNDEFYDILKDFTTIEQTSEGIIRDSKAGTILGNTTIDSSLCPIKNKKLEKLIRTQSQYYSPYRKYSKGENTIYKVKNSDGLYTSYTLESLTNGNIGNDPFLSPSWIIKDRFLDFITDIIYISLTPEGTGSIINPDTSITVKSDSNIDFSISEGVGYLFSGVSIITRSNEETIDLVENSDYTYTLEDTPDEYKKTVNISSWSSFIQPESEKYTSNLVFNFISNPSIIKFLIKKGGHIYHYNDWDSEFGEYNLSLEFRLNGNVVQPIYSTDGSDMYLNIPNPQLNPMLEVEIGGDLIKRRVYVDYRIGANKYTKILNIEDDTVSDYVNFSEATWTMNLESVTRVLDIRWDNTVVCDVTSPIEVDYGSTYIIPFSSTLVTTNRFPFFISIVNFYIDSDDRIVKNENEIAIESFPFTGELLLDDVETAIISVTPGESTGQYNLILSDIVENIMINISKN